MNKWIDNWFSNFKPFDKSYIYQNIAYRYPETFYQAMKTYKENISVRRYIASLTPSKAKKFWRDKENKRKYLRKDWINISLEVMEFILRFKFSPGTSWYKKLLNERGEIVEINNWHDNFYGSCVCERCKNKTKHNHLGKILMKIRDEVDMKQIYLNILIYKDQPVSIGMVSQSNETFYGEFSDFFEELPNGFSFRFKPPNFNEMDHWIWSKQNDVEVRGDKKEISKNLVDWFHAILGGALSWVDYSEEMGGPGYRNISPVIDTPGIMIRTMTEKEWNVFQEMFTNFPKCVVTTPTYVDSLTNKVSVPPLDEFRNFYHSGTSEFNPIDNCKVLISYINTAEKVKESQK